MKVAKHANYTRLHLPPAPPFMKVAKHANYTRLHLLCHNNWHVDHVLAELEPLTPADVSDFVSRVLGACHCEVLVHGNIRQAGAEEMAARVLGLLGPGCCLSAGERRQDQCTELELGVVTLCRWGAGGWGVAGPPAPSCYLIRLPPC